jgi:integrase
MARIMAKSHLKLVTPATVKRTVTPRRLPNKDLRTREHLTEAEVERLMKAAQRNRHGHRDATMILVAYRHGLRASELVDLRWDQVDFKTGVLHVRRVKQGTPSTPSYPRGRIAGPTAVAARAGPQVAVRLYVRARVAVHDGWLRAHDRTSGQSRQVGVQASSAHA